MTAQEMFAEAAGERSSHLAELYQAGRTHFPGYSGVPEPEKALPAQQLCDPGRLGDVLRGRESRDFTKRETGNFPSTGIP